VHPVEGKVLFNDQPCAEAEVVFHPLDGQLERGRRPQATTDANGRFVITTNIAGDGAVAKEYAITVELRDKIMRGEDMVRDGPNLLPARYAKPETSKLRYRVVEGINQVPVLKLTDAE
jgi:hypothetical protein